MSNPTTTYDGLESCHALWRVGDLGYQLWPQQIPIYDGVRSLPPSVSEAVVLCARQFGKSHLEVILAVEDCLRYPNSCILIIGPTLKQTTQIVTPRLKEISRDAPPGLVTQSKSESKWIVGSSELVIGGMDINSSSQRGKSVQNIYVEEIVDSKPDDYLESLRSDIGPALTHSKGGRILFITTPPKVPDHPFCVETLPKARLNNALYQYTIYDNKKLSKEQFRRCAELSGCVIDENGNLAVVSIDWRREYLCEIVRDERVTVIPDFDKDFHVRPCHLPPEAKLEVYIDWGGVRDKTVGLLTFYSFHENKLRVLDERSFQPNTSTAAIVEGLRAMEAQWAKGQYQISARWADAPGQLHVDLQTMGYEVRPPFKADWQAAVNNLQVMFRLNKIEIDPRCKLTIVTLESGQFNKQRTDFSRDSESLGHCDAIAALMYAARMFDKSNPYPVMHASQNTFIRPKEEMTVGEAIQPKTFGRVSVGKRFGSFR